jgi:hypothetical protein
MRRTILKIWTLELCAQSSATLRQIRLSAFSILFLSFCGIVSYAQVPTEPKIYVPTPPPAKPMPRTAPPTKVWEHKAKRIDNESETPAEKSISTDAKVSVKLCVSEGKVRINGWDRSEIRAFVSDGTEVGFKVLQKKGSKPVWVEVLGFDPQKNTEPGLDRCLAGDEIEIDVPYGANIDFTGQESEISIASVNKAKVNNVGGNIAISNIAQGVSAKTYEGGVLVENSTGAMSLISTNGNIVAFDIQPGEVGDTFVAKTQSGAITLQAVSFQQLDAGSNSGSIRFNGELANGGNYSFGTTNGSITLLVPIETSCKINATYAGAFVYELPLKDIQKTPGSPITLTALAGAGDANLNLRTLGGAIRIRKK